MSRADRILVVDDDPGLRSLLADYLTDAGFEVDLAGDGEQMRREIARGMPDAIVMDLMLPGSRWPRADARGASRRRPCRS